MDRTSLLMNKDLDPQPQGAARVGMEMRLVRERLGWRLADVAAELRIRLPYLEAIERGELSALPGAAYQTGFVRTYSQALGLDGDEILRRFRAEGTGFVPKAELSFLAPVPDRAVPTGAIVLLGVVLVLVGYGLWYRHTELEAQLAAQIPAVPMELAPLAVPPKPPVQQAPAKLAAVAPAPVQNAAPAAGTPLAPSAAAATIAPASAAPPAAQTAALPTPSPPVAPLAPSQVAEVIQATGDTWVEVQDAKGGILFSKTLHAGDSWPVPDLPGLILTAGNAGNTSIAQNGKAGAPLGDAGTVIRRYALTAPAPDAPAAAVQPASASASSLPVTIMPPPAAPPDTAGVEGPSPSGAGRTN